MDDQTLYRAAGISAGIAIVTLVISGIALALFFGGAGGFWGPVNDVFIAATGFALLLPIVAVDRLAGGDAAWLRVVTIIGIVGALVMAIGQLLLVVGVITLDDSYITGGIGFAGALIWILALVVLAFGVHAIPTIIGALAAVSLGLVVATGVIAAATTGPLLWVVTVVLLAALVAWLGSLATNLFARLPA